MRQSAIILLILFTAALAGAQTRNRLTLSDSLAGIIYRIDGEVCASYGIIHLGAICSVSVVLMSQSKIRLFIS